MLEDIVRKAKAVGEAAYWDLYFTIGYSCTAGVGNGLANDDFKHGFGEGFVNNFGFGLAVNAVYPAIFQYIKQRPHFRRNANIVALVVNSAFLAWHLYAGTKHPYAAALPNFAIGLAMTNRYVTEESRTP